jgi:hypothetical protein
MARPVKMPNMLKALQFHSMLKCSTHNNLPEYSQSKTPNLQGGSNMTGTNCDLFTHK